MGLSNMYKIAHIKVTKINNYLLKNINYLLKIRTFNKKCRSFHTNFFKLLNMWKFTHNRKSLKTCSTPIY
jgi:hypothetical protein